MEPEQAIFFDGLITALNNFILFGLVVLFRRNMHREGLSAFLLHVDRRGRLLFAEGIVVGFLAFLLYPLLLSVSNQGSLTIAPETLPRTLGLFVTTGLGFLGVALFEEGLFRGYVLLKLLKRFSQPVAIVLVAILFGILHLISYPTSDYLWLGLVNAGLFGVFLSVVVINSKSLMWVVGFHLAWNLTQSLLTLYQLSSVETLVNIKTTEGFLTGAYLVPEEGIFVTAIVAMLALYTSVRFRKRDANTQAVVSESG
jgi:membrane protease YdiL (CAAX protease family)